jgi:hypothetical protein
MATEAQRAHVKATIDFLHAHAGQLDYPPGDVRDSRDATSWHLTEQQAEHVLRDNGRMCFDCSETDAWILRCAGLYPWADPGYTGSHLARLPVHYTNPRVARIGALVVFGPGTGHHEAIVYEPDPLHGNPLLGSHGRAGYQLVRLLDEAAAQEATGHAGYVFLSIAHL